MSQQVAVIGLGRFGSAVARELHKAGHEVLGIDRDLEIVQRHAHVLSQVLQADAVDTESLERLGVGGFDSVVVAITENLESSILATLGAKQLGVPHVVAKAKNDNHGEILTRVGADSVVFPERDTGLRLAHSWGAADITDSLDIVEGYEVSRVQVPEAAVGKTIGESVATGGTGVSLILFASGSTVTTFPSADTRLARGDILVFAGQLDDINALVASLSTGRRR